MMHLKEIMPNNNFINKMTEKRRRRKAIKKAKASQLGGAAAEDYSESTSTSSKQVRFGSNSVTVYELPSTIDTTNTATTTTSELHQERKDQLWYNKKELNDQFLKDLETHIQQQVLRAQYGYEYQRNTNDSRGLEFHLEHNQRRKEKAEAYVRHIVEKAHEIRKEVGLLTNPASGMIKGGLGRKLDRRMAIRSINANPIAAQQYTDQIQELCSQYTWMTRELALGVAAEDAAAAKAIYQEETTSTTTEQQLDIDDSESSCSSSIFTTSDKSTTSSEFLRPRPQQARQQSQLKRPVSYNAKSA